LLDTPPALAKSNVDSGDFPMEAQRWGFEGWVRLEHDILANGRTAETRAVVAYPPFVFRDAAVKVAAAMRFQPTFRPGSTKGCMANQSSLNFRIAD
jgi:outer membrane biosynthesis protein TonB